MIRVFKFDLFETVYFRFVAFITCYCSVYAYICCRKNNRLSDCQEESMHLSQCIKYLKRIKLVTLAFSSLSISLNLKQNSSLKDTQ